MKLYRLLFMLLFWEIWYFNCCALMQLLNMISLKRIIFPFHKKQIITTIIIHRVHESLINMLKVKKILYIKTKDVKKNRN